MLGEECSQVECHVNWPSVFLIVFKIQLSIDI